MTPAPFSSPAGPCTSVSLADVPQCSSRQNHKPLDLERSGKKTNTGHTNGTCKPLGRNACPSVRELDGSAGLQKAKHGTKSAIKFHPLVIGVDKFETDRAEAWRSLCQFSSITVSASSVSALGFFTVLRAMSLASMACSAWKASRSFQAPWIP